MAEWKNKVALITGSSRGIGKAIAIKFATMGIKLILNYRKREEEANKTLEEIKSAGSEAIAIRCNVAKYEEVKQLVKQARDHFGKIDILVNNAALGIANSFLEMDVESWQKQIEVSLNSCFYVTKEVVSDMINQRWGRIINISSLAGIYGIKYLSAYSAAKAGVIALTKVLDAELSQYNITVNAIAPGFVETEMGFSYFKVLELMKGIKNPLEKFLKYSTLTKKLVKSEEVAEVASMLISPLAENITGQIFIIDSGSTLSILEPVEN